MGGCSSKQQSSDAYDNNTKVEVNSAAPSDRRKQAAAAAPADGLEQKKALSEERDALKDIFEKLNGPRWCDSKKKDWLTNKSVSAWAGVKCNSEGNVVELALDRLGNGTWGPKSRRGGTISPKIAALAHLEMLDLRANAITGMIPSEFTRLEKLQKCDLAFNKLSGIPEGIEKMPKLKLFRIHKNPGAKGTLPVEWDMDPDFTLSVDDTQLKWPRGWLSLAAPSFPLHLVRVSELLKLERIPSHEEAFANHPNLLVPVEELVQFQSWRVLNPRKQRTGEFVLRENTMFLSHRWLSDKHPDDEENSKLAQIKALLQQPRFQLRTTGKTKKIDNKNIPVEEGVKFVFMDYLSVPQARTRAEEQLSAILSLPHYVKCCRAFATLCGPPETRASLEVYLGRGWCRLERVSALCPFRGQVPEAFVHDKAAPGAVAPADLAAAAAAALNPLGGEFFAASDRDTVRPCVQAVAAHMTRAKQREVREMGQELQELVGRLEFLQPVKKTPEEEKGSV